MKKLNDYLQHYFLLALLIALSCGGCKKDNNNDPIPPVTYERGDIVNSTSLGIYTSVSIQQILDATGEQFPFTLVYSVEVLSVNYYTIDGAGNNIIVSGAMFVPQGVNDLPLISLQHGTETKRELVASISPYNSVEGIIGIMTASMGYMTVVPDYPGFGVSAISHPYMHMNSLVPCVIDFMRACNSYCSANQITMDGRVFLTGYSEGGYVTLGTQKAIEEDYPDEFNLTAVAPLAGPYDLSGMTDTIFNDDSYGTPTYVAYFLTAYNHIYGWDRLDEFFEEPYALKMSGLFNGSKSWGEIVNQLPASFVELMNPVFVDDFIVGNESLVSSAIRQNTLLDWTPKAPLNFIHGDADEIVPVQNSITAINRFTANGAQNIQLTTIPGGTHATAGPVAIVGAIQWFESL